MIRNDLLGYPRYHIYQDPNMFSFSLDSMLIADFVEIKKNSKKIMDLGTGNGVIPMYLTLKTKVPIYGIEIQETVLELAKKSVFENKLDDQITLLQRDIKGIHKEFKSFDIVVSNPPYFKYKDSSITNKTPYKTIARHEVFITLEELIFEASKLLKTKGSFYLIHKPDRLTDCLVLLRKHGLEPKRLRLVYPKKNTNPNHILIEAMKDGKEANLTVLEPLYVYEDNKWTQEILNIYNKGEEDYAFIKTK